MTFNEQDHPRDKMGKFTFKNGTEEKDTNEKQNQKMTPFKLGAEINVYKNETLDETPVEILYGKSKNTEEQKQAENKYRNILLDVLGKKATPAMVLLKNSKQLEKIVKENGLWDKVKESEKLKKLTKEIIGENYNRAKSKAANYISGPDTAGMLDLAHGEENMNNPDYIKDTVKLKNYEDPKIKQYQEYFKEKIENQFRDYGYNSKDIKGYFFNNNSEPSQRIIQNKDFRNYIKENYNELIKENITSISFPKHGPVGILKNNNFKNALGKADIKFEEVDKQGNLHLKIFDTYDFNKEAKDFLNKAGREEMLKGNLKPFFTIHDILIPKSELDRIWNEE